MGDERDERLSLEGLIVRLDAAIAELAEVRRQLAEMLPAPAADEKGTITIGTLAADDLSDEHLIEVSTAVERFNRPADTIRFWCRREGCGKKVGGRWLASVPRIERRLNGGG
jgi:hypothetical protein